MSWTKEGCKIAAQNGVASGADLRPGDTFMLSGEEYALTEFSGGQIEYCLTDRDRWLVDLIFDRMERSVRDQIYQVRENGGRSDVRVQALEDMAEIADETRKAILGD